MATGNIRNYGSVQAPQADEYAIMVLLVDDQLMVGEAIRRALSTQPNIDFHYCPNPEEALSIAEEVKPTVILQDLIMPGIDGLTLVREYRAHPFTKDIPIIVLSTKEEPAIKSEAFMAGANDYLVKLPDEIELIARIRHHSKAYLNQLQRDDAYRALRESQRQLMEMNFQLHRLTNMDGLTGLSNRRYFEEIMESEWKRAIRAQSPLALLMIDVDDFKKYNDTYGHLAGDEVLRNVADTIQKNAGRSADMAARFGGEEFALILPETPLAGAMHLGEQLRKDVESLQIPHTGSTAGPYLTASVGCASLIPNRTESFFLLIDTADKALYDAKRAGKNKVLSFENSAASGSPP